VPQEQFATWLQGEAAEEKDHAGEEVMEKLGCFGCHSLDGSRKVGPTLLGIWGKSTVVTSNGKERTVVVDEAYLRRAIMEPHAEIVKGYPPVMPQYKDLSSKELQSIIQFIKEQGNSSGESR
jgi:cytochrome c oxidase subunit 2